MPTAVAKKRRRFAEHHTYAYQKAREQLLGLPCWQCGEPATSADHVPALAEWYATHNTPWQGELRPSCTPCQYRNGGWTLANRLRQGTPQQHPTSPIWR